MKCAVISSGSKANCTYLENSNSAILIDCGLSAKQAVERMKSLGVDLKKLKGILVTHEHSDHTNGIPVLSRRLEIPVFTNLKNCKKINGVYAVEEFVTGEDFEFENFAISPFSVVHDAKDPVGFAIKSEGVKFAQATDLGRVTNLVKLKLENSNFLVVETNYDQQKLHNCEYPWELKQRINSIHGHLSNEDGALLVEEVNNSNLDYVVLGHLSENSNEPNLALSAIDRVVRKKDFKSLICGSVYKSTPIYTI